MAKEKLPEGIFRGVTTSWKDRVLSVLTNIAVSLKDIKNIRLVIPERKEPEYRKKSFNLKVMRNKEGFIDNIDIEET